MAKALVTVLALASLALGYPQDTTDDFALTPNPQNQTLNSFPASNVESAPVEDAGQSRGGSAGWAYKGPAFIADLRQQLHPQLPQNQTNGASVLGTWRAPRLPDWMTGHGEPMPQGFPWGGRTCANTDPYQNPPDTGVIRHYDFTVSRKTIWPDGVQKDALVVNGAFPGPTIEANWGDWIEVTVHNTLNEGTSMHWHGLLQKETPYMDGVPGITQCPIPPGGTFTYRFKADLYGTSWWHSHYSAQYAGGLIGPMIIYGPHDNAQYDVDLGPILINDWYHKDYFSIVKDVMAPAAAKLPPPLSNNNLINGKMNYPCATLNNSQSCIPNAGVAKFNFTSGKTYRLRLINAGAEAIQKFSIDNHDMVVIANDFVPTVPYKTNVVTLGIGQRTDIIVKANGKAGDAVWMRSTLGKNAFVGGCTLHDGISPEALAAIYYENANHTSIPNTTTAVPQSDIDKCANDPLDLSVPFYTIKPPAQAATTQRANIDFKSNGTHNLFFINNSSFRVDFNDPIYLETKLGNTKFAPSSNVYNFGSNSSIRIELYNYAPTGAHPMHLHGHNMYVLAEGYGTKWDGVVTRTYNPQRRDVHLLQNAKQDGTPAYMVLQIDADNPGSWPLHCHIAWHVSAGLYMNILERPADIRKARVPSVMAQTCRDWSSYTGRTVVEQIDSGL